MNALLSEALSAFGLKEAVFVQQHENAVYRADGQYLLRIHKVAEGLLVDHDPALRRSELALLAHLADAGLPVQRPIAEATLSDGTQATLLTWLEGRSLTNNDLTADVCLDLGRLVRQMHRAAEGCHPAGMRRYDTGFYGCMADELDGILGQREIPRAACAAVAQRIGSYADTAIHADLSPSNILLTPAGLAPIDFSLCGMGHPMLDLGILIASLSTPAQMKAVCEGHGAVSMPELEAGFAAGLLGCFALHPAWPKEPWFRERIDRWERQILRPVAEGRPMFDDEMNFINR